MNDIVAEIRAKMASRKQLDDQLTALLGARGFIRTHHEPTGGIRFSHPETYTVVELSPPFGIYLSFFAPTGRGDDQRLVYLGEIHEAPRDNEGDTIAYLATTLHLAADLRNVLGISEPD
ncbi:hypothetical protein [Amycolatopsis sp. cmx-4-61]|uniref:hypothetical protein n=1 Tax=Amycolatopsis sp. cmx-4-61 TaxID=2790937 RepID=UPI00397AE62B